MSSCPPLSIQITTNCNIACKHCCQNDHVKKNVKPTDVETICDELNSIGFTGRVLLTGGEPFLHKNLIEIIQSLHRHSFKYTIITNAFWCNNQSETIHTLNTLHKYGLEGITTSLDAFHSQFIPTQNIVNLVKASNCVKLSMSIYASFSKRTKDHTERLLLNIKNYDNNIKIYRRWVTPVYSASSFKNDTRLYRFAELDNYCPSSNFLTISSDLTCFPCCSAATHFQLAFGSLKKQSIREVLDQRSRSKMHKMIEQLGPKGLVFKLPYNEKLQFTEGYYSNICHLCYDLFSKYPVEFLEKQSKGSLDLVSALLCC